jgi:hypothetical protein
MHIDRNRSCRYLRNTRVNLGCEKSISGQQSRRSHFPGGCQESTPRMIQMTLSHRSY